MAVSSGSVEVRVNHWFDLCGPESDRGLDTAMAGRRHGTELAGEGKDV